MRKENNLGASQVSKPNPVKIKRSKFLCHRRFVQLVNIDSNENEKLEKLEGIFIVCLIRLGEALQTRGQGYPYG